MVYYRLSIRFDLISKKYYRVLLSAVKTPFVALMLQLRFSCCTRLAQRTSHNTKKISFVQKFH